MKSITHKEADEALFSLSALRSVLTDELEKIEAILTTVSPAQGLDGIGGDDVFTQCQRVHAGLRSGLASIEDTFVGGCF